MKKQLLLTLVCVMALALPIAACSSGPGGDCDDCASTEANPAATNTGPGSAAAAGSAAEGGLRGSADPSVSDRWRVTPFTGTSRGSGNTNVNPNIREVRTQSGGPVTTQAVNAGTYSSAQAGNGRQCTTAPSRHCELLERRAQQLEVALLAVLPEQADGTPNPVYMRLSTQLDKTLADLGRAESDWRTAYLAPRVVTDQRGQVVTQVQGTGVKTNTPENAIDPQNLKAGADGVSAAVEKGGAAAAGLVKSGVTDGPPSGLSSTPSPPADPKATKPASSPEGGSPPAGNGGDPLKDAK